MGGRLPGVQVIFIVFGGVYVNADNVPAALKWLPNISMIKYCFEVRALLPVIAAALPNRPSTPGAGPIAMLQRMTWHSRKTACCASSAASCTVRW